jgi:hypothetical protein
MDLCCQQDERRETVRQLGGWYGLDYVEVADDQLTLYLYFLGKLPPELNQKKPGLGQYLSLEGGRRITGIRIIHVDPVTDPDPEKDEYLVIGVDRYGDFSTYTLRLVGVARVDPRYDHADFSFKVNCPSDLDCAPACACAPPAIDEPELNYLAKDYGSFRQLILDRLAVLTPNWKEAHAADLGITLVELLAYVGDYLSYYQDAVATEAYLETARRRISVRRHVRLVDYRLSEGCNARTWVCVETSGPIELDPAITSFITGLNDALAARPTLLTWGDLAQVPATDYEVFRPLLPVGRTKIDIWPAHNEIHLYTWGERECCLAAGSTSATLLDPGTPASDAKETNGRALRLQPGDALIFEEVIGPGTGLPADADPSRRHAVRITSVTPGEDPVLLTKNQPTPYLDITWGPQDALPFPLCISAIGPAPTCPYLENVTVARGNVILVDHGQAVGPEDLGQVGSTTTSASCECEGEPGDIQIVPVQFCPQLDRTPLTSRQPLPVDDPAKSHLVSAARLLQQDVRSAVPQVDLTSTPAAAWAVRYDLVESGPDDAEFVVEIDNEGVAHLRFGDGELGFQPPAGMAFQATYRVGNGAAGNVGAESISRMVLQGTWLSGITITVRNPLPAVGGTDPESIDQAKLLAPHQFRKRLERAIIAQDYAQLAEENPHVQRAAAALKWTGSWYEADVAIDPLGSEDPGAGLLDRIECWLECYRRIGHDVAVVRARYVPLDLELLVCVLPQYQAAHVKAALLDVFSNRVLAGGRLGFFHPDNLTFGEGIYLSRIVAAGQAIPGVECIQVVRFHRLFEAPRGEIENGILPLRPDEIAQLDNDPNYPEHGRLRIQVRGGL